MRKIEKLRYTVGPKHTPTGILVDTKKRVQYIPKWRSIGNIFVSLGISYAGTTLVIQQNWYIRYLFYACFIFLCINSTWEMLDCWTAYFESVQASKSEQATWSLCDKKLYEHSILLNTTKEGQQVPRNVCVITSSSSTTTTSTLESEINPKPVILFVHGSMARIGQYAALIKLAEENDYTYVAYDMYGMGRSPKPEQYRVYETDEHLSDLYHVYRFTCETYPKRPVIMIGHSYGCCLTLKLAFNLKDSCVDTSSLGLPKALLLLGAYRWNKASARSKTMKRLFGLPLWFLRLIRPLLSSGFKAKAFAPTTLTDETMKSVLEYSDALSGNNAFHVVSPFYCSSAQQTLEISDIERFDKSCESSSLNTTKIYFITGEQDALAPPSEARLLASLLKSTSKGNVTVVNDAGHQVMEERPENIFDMIQKIS